MATCLLPAPPVESGVLSRDGTWTHLYVRVAHAASLVVTSSPARPGPDPRTALERPYVPPLGSGLEPAGPIASHTLPAGEVLTRTFRIGEGLLRTEARLERDGRAWVWSLTRPERAPGAAVALDSVLASWRWV